MKFTRNRKTKYAIEPGQRHGRLTAIRMSHRNSHGAFFLCKCDCGNETTVGRSNFFFTKSCGCLRRERISETKFKHGMSNRGHPDSYIYQLWIGIKKRCYNKKEKRYDAYGGRGIRIFPGWRNDFLAFHKYITEVVGHRPSEDHSIDRIEVNGNYEPGNLRWSDCIGQARNRRNSFKLKWGSGKVTLKDFCEKFGVPYKSAWAFLNDPAFHGRL